MEKKERMGFEAGRLAIEKPFLIILAALCISISTAVAAEIKVALVTPAGEPGASGLTVRLLCGGEPKAEAVWSGEPLVFQPDGCPGAQIEVGYPQEMFDKSKGFVRLAVSMVDPSAGAAVVNVAVPELVQVKVRTLDLARQPGRRFWAGFKDMEHEAREGEAAPRQDCMMGQTVAICYLPPGQYRFITGPLEEIVAVEWDGRSLPQVETGDPNAWGTVNLEGVMADLAIILR